MEKKRLYQKLLGFYEQGASKERAGAYLRRWLGWAGVGILLCVELGEGRVSLSAEIGKGARVGAQTLYFSHAEDVDFVVIDELGARSSSKVYKTIPGEPYIGVKGQDHKVKVRFLTPVERLDLKCGEKWHDWVCTCKGLEKGCWYSGIQRVISTSYVVVNCGEHESCMVYVTRDKILIWFRRSEDDYVKVMEDENNGIYNRDIVISYAK